MVQPNRRLYKLLDVDPAEATSERIRADFDKMSLREQFHQAYVILSDPDRKRLYDIGGERTVDYLLSKSWGPMVPILGSKWCIRLHCFSLLVGSLALLAWFILLAVKLDGSYAPLTWGGTFAPLLVVLAGNLLVHLLSFACSVATTFSREDSDGVLLDRLPPCLNVLSASCYLAFAIIIAAALNGNEIPSVQPWLRYFSLLIIGDVLSLLASCTWRHPEKVRRSLSQKFKNPPAIIVYGFTVMIAIAIILSVLRWVLIGAKIDGTFTASWYRAFAPIPVRLFFGVLETLLQGVYMRRLEVRTRGEVFFLTLGTLFVNSLVCVSVYLLAATLEGARLVSMANILIPIYVLMGYLVLAAIFTCFLLPADDRRQDALEQQIRVTNPTSLHDPYRSSQGANPALRSTNYYVGGVPLMMADNTPTTSESTRQRGTKPLVIDEGTDSDMMDEEEEEEMEEIEVDEEPEHYIDDIPHGSAYHQHSPFEGPGDDVSHMHRYRYQGGATAPMAVDRSGNGFYDDSRQSSFSLYRGTLGESRRTMGTMSNKSGASRRSAATTASRKPYGGTPSRPGASS